MLLTDQSVFLVWSSAISFPSISYHIVSILCRDYYERITLIILNLSGQFTEEIARHSQGVQPPMVLYETSNTYYLYQNIIISKTKYVKQLNVILHKLLSI